MLTHNGAPRGAAADGGGSGSGSGVFLWTAAQGEKHAQVWGPFADHLHPAGLHICTYIYIYVCIYIHIDIHIDIYVYNMTYICVYNMSLYICI
jgi:hypothetical protein